MRKTRSALFVAMLATLLVGMTAVGSTAATPRKLPAGTASTVAADIGLAPYVDTPIAITDEGVTFTYGNESIYPVMILNVTFPDGVTITGATITGATCDTTNAVVTVPDGRHVVVSGIACDPGTPGENLTVEVDGTSTLLAGTYAVSAEFKVLTPKRVKTPVNMWQVFDLDAILVAS